MKSAPNPNAPITRSIMVIPPVKRYEARAGPGREACRLGFTMRRLLFVVLLTAFATAAPAQEQKTPAQQTPKSAAGGRTANLPDFTALMKQQGPAVVNVITKREATKGPRGQQG